jgi:Trehalose utilisation
MLSRTASFLSFSLVFAACSDGSDQLAALDAGGTTSQSMSNSGGATSASSSGAGSGSNSGSTSSSSSGAGATSSSGTGPSSSGSSGGGGSTGSSGMTSGSSSGSSSGGAAADASSSSGSAATDPYSGPFKILVLSKTLGYHHDSIPGCQQMLRELGRCVDAESCAMTNDTFISAAKKNSSFTVDVAGAPSGCPELAKGATTPASDPSYTTYTGMGCDGAGTPNDDPISHMNSMNLDVNQFSSVTAATTTPGPYQFIFFCSPTGTDFTSDGANGMAGETAIQNFIQAGAGYGGVHAASDFEDTEMWQWYYNDLMGSWFKDHNNDGTPGTVITASMYLTHPVMNGIPNPWNTQDEWYLQNREMTSVPGFQILATLSGVPALAGESATDIRPIVWIKQFPATAPFEGRMFYTVRGHNIARYGEVAFRQLVHQGILWAANRLN